MSEVAQRASEFEPGWAGPGGCLGGLEGGQGLTEGRLGVTPAVEGRIVPAEVEEGHALVGGEDAGGGVRQGFPDGREAAEVSVDGGFGVAVLTEGLAERVDGRQPAQAAFG